MPVSDSSICFDITCSMSKLFSGMLNSQYDGSATPFVDTFLILLVSRPDLWFLSPLMGGICWSGD